jgi:hypothetical protein
MGPPVVRAAEEFPTSTEDDTTSTNPSTTVGDFLDNSTNFWPSIFPIRPTNVRFTHQDGTLINDATHYRQLVGSLIYLTVTRLDISYVVHLVSQFMASQRTTHYIVVLRIIWYIKGTLFYGLHFSTASSLILRAYSDPNLAGDSSDRSSTIGFCIFLGDPLISWRRKKQTLTARCSSESEYHAFVDTTCGFAGFLLI